MFHHIKGITMKNTISAIVLLAFLLLITIPGIAEDKAANKYVGVKTCSMCHKAQLAVWEKSKHAEAIKTLSSPKAAEIAKAKGLKKAAAESEECLSCHMITAKAAEVDKNFDAKQGVQCETCHGAGSAYKAMSTMKDKAKAVAVGMTEYKDEAAIEKQCKTCHNEKSPTFKEFKFKEAWAKVKHPKKT
jgi:competence protein ComGC